MARRSKTCIKSPANTNGWLMGSHFSQAEIISTATKWGLERCQHDLGRPEGGAVIDCRAGCMAQKTNYLGRSLRRLGSRSKKSTLPEAERAEEARYCGNNGHTWASDRCPNCRRAVSDLERARTAKIRKYANNPDIERAIDRSNQHPSPIGHPLLEGYLVQIIRIRFPGTGYHHPERSRCHRHPCAHRWYHRPPRLQSFNRCHVRKMTSPKADYHPVPWMLPAVLRHNLLWICS